MGTKTFSDRLDQALADNGLDNAGLARLLGPRGHQLVNAWRARGRVGVPSEKAVANALPRTNMTWLQHGTGDRISDESQSGRWTVRDQGFADSPSTRLDHTIIEPAVTMARAMVAVELGSGADFDPHGDISLFVAAYDLMAEPTTETRQRFEQAMSARVTATRGKNEQGSSDKASDRRGQ